MTNIELFNIREKYIKKRDISLIDKIFEKKYNISDITYYFLDSRGGLTEFNEKEIYKITQKFYENKEYFINIIKNFYICSFFFKKLIQKNSFEPFTFFIFKYLLKIKRNNTINEEIYLNVLEFSNFKFYKKIINDEETKKLFLNYIYDKKNKKKIILHLLKNKNFSFVKEIVNEYNFFIDIFTEGLLNDYIGYSTFRKSNLQNLKLFFKKIDKKYLSNKLIENIIFSNNSLNQEKYLNLINFLINKKKEVKKFSCDYFIYQISLIIKTRKEIDKNILKKWKTSFFLILNYINEKKFNSIILNKINNIIYLFIKKDIISYKYFYYLLVEKKYIDMLVYNHCNISKEDILNSKFYKKLINKLNKSIDEKDYKKIKDLSFVLKNYII